MPEWNLLYPYGETCGKIEDEYVKRIHYICIHMYMYIYIYIYIYTYTYRFIIYLYNYNIVICLRVIYIYIYIYIYYIRFANSSPTFHPHSSSDSCILIAGACPTFAIRVCACVSVIEPTYACNCNALFFSGTLAGVLATKLGKTV